MSWKAIDTMTLRQEFLSLARQEGVNMSALCAQFGISRKTGYRLLARVAEEGLAGMADRSRRPLHSPQRTDADVEELVVGLRKEHPAWGARKLQRRLRDLGHQGIPTPSTITRILHRHHLVDPQASEDSTPWTRFEHAAPNDLWQMDFKGCFETASATCHPLTVIDDHSRYNLTLAACARPNREHVQAALQDVFRRHGMPVRINADNGSPWGSPSRHEHGITRLTIWLIQLGIQISHSRPAHPQTNGKNERFHRSLKREVLRGQCFRDLDEAQEAFDGWRQVYNHERPHEALGLATPVTRYRPSRRVYPETLPEIHYRDGDLVQVVGWDGKIVVQGRRFRVSNALHTHPIAARPHPRQDGVFDLYFAHHRFGQIDLRTTKGDD
ncbi:IS481 family transposase [Noviherbaspirillum cavernae]|uniref:IS481 family transposase n=1 Tax=Noviherbaspirillum cavernae TaxID=2320862 RepID=A0A418X289_9BURK|nr:IS481 family transposase [Noviherbaspirillum cavernae]RJG06541.1 IS481 family transposase [Noviherbaspirillum cavernae]RJG06897.1 IS481 family transposase [Noviherbaspirillum cavernae]RJG07091.1 IS481 family transposase [Noviherbaspirillum cavernae]